MGWGILCNDLETERPHCANRLIFSIADSLMKAFSTAVSLAEYEAAEAKPIKMPCKFCKAEDHAHENCGVKHLERRGNKLFINHQHLKSVTKMASRIKAYLKSTGKSDESTLAKLKNERDDDFRDK